MSTQTPKILLVGAGAVGQVYGRHMNLGGANVSFFVREKYREELKGGMPMYPLNHQNVKTTPVQFQDFNLVTTPEEVAAGKFDEIWLCVASDALRGPWLAPLLEASQDAVVVSLTPGIEDRDFLLQWVPESRLVCGMITLISYQAPLRGETVHSPGMAYWFPPATPGYFSGPKPHVEAIVSRLKRGGQPVGMHRDVSELGSAGTAVLMPLLLGLERESWSFRQFGQTSGLKDGIHGAREAIEIVAAQRNMSAPLWRKFLIPSVFRLGLWLGAKILPLPLETYLQYHFTKVGSQTRLFIDTFIRLGESHGLSTEHLRSLRASVPAVALKS